MPKMTETISELTENLRPNMDILPKFLTEKINPDCTT